MDFNNVQGNRPAWKIIFGRMKKKVRIGKKKPLSCVFLIRIVIEAIEERTWAAA